MPSTFAAHATALLQRIQRGLSAVELIHVPYDRWPLPVHIHRPPTPSPTLRISVLDSSFNPPTLAHLALANSPVHATNQEAYDYDAKLLLLSVRNADKALKPGDATFVQRLEMMVLLAKSVSSSRPTSSAVVGGELPQQNNVAVAIVDEPTFVGKSAALLAFLRARLLPSPMRPQLTFLQGFDTLERLLSPRYYPSEDQMLRSLRAFFSPDGDGSRVVCARRVSYTPQEFEQAQEKHQEEYERELRVHAAAKEFVDAGQVVLIDIGDEERTFSSSEVRDRVARKDEGWRKFLIPSIADYIAQEGLYVQRI